MTLSKSSIDLLTDMLENRLSDMVVTDREDAKEQVILRRALQELATIALSEGRANRRATATATPVKVKAIAASPAPRASSLPSSASRPLRRPMLRNNPMLPLDRANESMLIGTRITEMV